MIAIWYDGDGAVTDRRVTGDATLLGQAGVILIAHPRKATGDDTSNLIDIALADGDALTAPLYQITVVDGAPVVDLGAVAPAPVDPPAILTAELEAAIDAVVALDQSRGPPVDHATRDTAGQDLAAALADSRI